MRRVCCTDSVLNEVAGVGLVARLESRRVGLSKLLKKFSKRLSRLSSVTVAGSVGYLAAAGRGSLDSVATSGARLLRNSPRSLLANRFSV